MPKVSKVSLQIFNMSSHAKKERPEGRSFSLVLQRLVSVCRRITRIRRSYRRSGSHTHANDRHGRQRHCLNVRLAIYFLFHNFNPFYLIDSTSTLLYQTTCCIINLFSAENIQLTVHHHLHRCFTNLKILDTCCCRRSSGDRDAFTSRSQCRSCRGNIT